MIEDLKEIANCYNWSEVYNLAEDFRQQQQWQPAAVAFQRAIELKPDFFWSWHNLGDALTKLQQWQKAAISYQRAVEIDPNFFWSWHNLGDALTKLQQWDKAIAVYLQAVLLQPDRQSIYQKIGTLFKQRGNLEQSIQNYRRLIQSSQPQGIYNSLKNQPNKLLDIANNLIANHQTQAAIVFYYLVLEVAPQETQVLVQLAQLLDRQTKLERDLTARQQTLNSEFLTRQAIASSPRKATEHIPGKIAIEDNYLISAETLEKLCNTVGWSSRPLNKVQQALNNSFCYVTAWYFNDGKQELIGFARAISDGAFHAVLLDILVHPRFQNRGIGKKIVRKLIARLKESEIQDITLFASPHITDFYHKLGFVSQPNNLQWMLLHDKS